MTKFAKWKKVVFIIVCILVAIRILYIGIRGEVDKEYITSTTYDLTGATEVPCQNVSETFVSNNDRLNSLELLFNNISEDKAGAVTLVVAKGDTTVYQTGITLANVNNSEWKKIYVNLEIEPGAEYRITLNSNEACTQIPTVFIVEQGAAEIVQSFQNGIEINGKVAINYGFLRYPGIYDRLSIISLWLIFVVIFYFFLFYFETIKMRIRATYNSLTKLVNCGALNAIIEILLVIIIMNSSGIDYQAPTKVIFYVLSLLSVLKWDDKNKYISTLVDKPAKKVFMYLLYVYAAFALVGQRIPIYPLTLKLTTAGIFVFCITIAWFVPIINSLIYYLNLASKRFFATQNSMKTPLFLMLCICVLLIPAVYNLFANNPGISSPDTRNSMITNAQHLHGMYDWHPAFYCMVLRAIEKISNTTYAVILVQYFFWAYVMLELILYLRKKGVKDSILVGVALFTGINAGNFMHINTIWKDIPYTLSLMWAFIIVAKLSIDYEEYKRKWYIYLEFIIAMVGVYLYRKNGMVSFIIIALALVIILRKNLKVWISVVIATSLVFTIKGSIYDYFEVEDPGKHGIYIGLGQDVLGVYYAGGEVSEETLEMVTMMTNYNNAEYSYTPTWSKASYDIDVEPIDFIKIYMDTFIKNPVIMTRAIIDREDALWDIFIGQDSTLGCVNYYGTQDSNEEWAENYSKRRYVSLYTQMSAATNYTSSTQWIAAIEWRCGLFTLLGIASLIFVVFRKGIKKYIVVLAPIIGHVLSLLLSTGWSDFRYFWPMNLMNMALILVAVVVAGPNDKIKGGDS